MADPRLQSVPPLRRPLLLLACLVTLVALAVGFSGTDERLLLAPAAVALVWAAAYRAQPNESVRELRGTSAGVVVVRRPPPTGPRRRREMPPTPSEYAPSAAVAQARAKSKDGKPLIKRVQSGLPDRPAAPVSNEKNEKDEKKSKGKRRKGKGGGEGGKPTLGL